MRRRPTNAARFAYIKNLLRQEGATINGVARLTRANWATVQKISRADSFTEFKGTDVSKTPSTVNLQPVNLVAQLKAERDTIVKQFNDVIATVERLKL